MNEGYHTLPPFSGQVLVLSAYSATLKLGHCFTRKHH
jgi:hypothetical protein